MSKVSALSASDGGKGRTRVVKLRGIQSGAIIGKGTKVHREAFVSGSAKIGAHCYIGKGSYIGPGVVIKNNVVIGENVTIENNVFLGEHVTVKDGAHIFVGADIGWLTVIGERSVVKAKNIGYQVIVEADAILGPGCRIDSMVVIGTESRVGPKAHLHERVHLDANVRIGSGAVLETRVQLEQSVRVGPKCHIGRHTQIWSGTRRIKKGESIGQYLRLTPDRPAATSSPPTNSIDIPTPMS